MKSSSPGLSSNSFVAVFQVAAILLEQLETLLVGAAHKRFFSHARYGSEDHRSCLGFGGVAGVSNNNPRPPNGLRRVKSMKEGAATSALTLPAPCIQDGA